MATLRLSSYAQRVSALIEGIGHAELFRRFDGAEAVRIGRQGIRFHRADGEQPVRPARGDLAIVDLAHLIAVHDPARPRRATDRTRPADRRPRCR